MRGWRAVVVVSVSLVLAGCGGGDGGSRDGGATPSSTPTATTGSGAPATSASPTTGEKVVRITVTGGKVDGPGRVKLDRGARVRLVVTSDVADEVHVHGYDISRDVAPGTPAEIAFKANLPGQFEVELEERGLLLVRLAVS